MKVTVIILCLLCSLLPYGCADDFAGEPIYDSHVHLMSPDLVKDWLDAGIPFSHSASYYSNIDTILLKCGADKIDLIGMGYVYGNPDYYSGDNAYSRLVRENNFILEESAKYPKKVTPYIAVDPLKKYAIKEIERCFGEAKQMGLKLHFSTSQVYLTEPEHLRKVKPIFKLAAENKIPILLHFDNWHPKFGAPDITILVDSILKDIPAVDLRIAHFGTSGGFNEKTKAFLDAFLKLVDQDRIPPRHRILFDISAVALDKDSEGVSKLTQEEFASLATYIDRLGIDKVLFGTDYPLYESKSYLEVLKEKVGLTDIEINAISRKRN